VDLLQERDGATAAEIAQGLSMSRSAVFNYLTTLEANGYLVRDGSTYHLGLRFLNVGEFARSRIDGLPLIEESVAELTRETNEEVDFVVEDHGRIVPVVESYHDLNYYSEQAQRPVRRAGVGTYYYMHTTASGKALLAEKSEDELDAILDRWGLPAQTDDTITDREQLLEDIAAAREQGYAITDEEFTEGNRSIAMVVRNDEDDPIGALAVTGPTYRFREEAVHDHLASVLRDHVERIEAGIRKDTR